jgi:hypothetical protein
MKKLMFPALLSALMILSAACSEQPEYNTPTGYKDPARSLETPYTTKTDSGSVTTSNGEYSSGGTSKAFISSFTVGSKHYVGIVADENPAALNTFKLVLYFEVPSLPAAYGELGTYDVCASERNAEIKVRADLATAFTPLTCTTLQLIFTTVTDGATITTGPGIDVSGTGIMLNNITFTSIPKAPY